MAPRSNSGNASGRKYARVVASRFKAANARISGSNRRLEIEKVGKKKSQTTGRKRKTVDSGANEPSSSKRPSRKEISKQSDEKEHWECVTVDEAEVKENLIGGLKLLKRETVTMSWLTASIIRGKKIYINYNSNGDPIGKEYGWLQSYIGVLARTRIPVSYKTWRNVPSDEKEKIWECVTKLFVLDQSKRKEVISSAATKWRNFKTKLTTYYIMPHKDDLEALENVPDDYRFMNKDDWHTLVTERLSEAALELRHKQIMKRKKNKYNHRLSRSGYRRVRVEMAKSMSTEELDKVRRHEFWIKARQDQQGNFKDAAVEEAVQKIRDLEKEEAGGVFKAEGTNDVLTVALGNPEHRGRVRGVGGMKPVVFFKLPAGKRGRKKQAEELEALLAKERTKWEEDMNQKHEEELRKLQQKYEADLKKSEEKLSEKLSMMIEARLSSKVVTSHNSKIADITAKSGEWSCTQPIGGEVNKSVNTDVTLSVESIDNIVAYGKLVESQLDDPSKQTIHGMTLGEDKIRVEVLVPVDCDAKLPFPIKGEMELVKEALGSIVAWPRNLCVIEGVNDRADQEPSKSLKKCTNRNGKLATAEVDDVLEDLKNLPAKLPKSLIKLCQWSDDALRDGRTVHTTFGPELYGHEAKAAIFRSDIHVMVHMNQITANTLVFYTSYLYNVLKKAQLQESFLFVDPKRTFAIGTNKTPTDRSNELMERFKMGKDGSLFLLPYNSRSHWTLTVVDPANKKAFWLDPLKRRLPDTPEWAEEVMSFRSEV